MIRLPWNIDYAAFILFSGVIPSNSAPAISVSSAAATPFALLSMANEPVANPSANNPIDQSTHLPFGADDFWGKVSRLLNQQRGYITKKQFEREFQVTFGPPERDRDAASYSLEEGKTWYFSARLTVYAAISPTAPSTREFKNAYMSWQISWNSSAFANAGEHCVTAEMVRKTLVANGWTSPWSQWGEWEKQREKVAAELRLSPPINLFPPPAPMPEATFRRQSDANNGIRSVLPQGQIFTSGQEGGHGDSEDSCVTSIQVDASAS